MYCVPAKIRLIKTKDYLRVLTPLLVWTIQLS